MRTVFSKLANLSPDVQFVYHGQRFRYRTIREDAAGTALPPELWQEILEVVVNHEWINADQFVVYGDDDAVMFATTLPALGQDYFAWNRPNVADPVKAKQSQWELRKYTNDAGLLNQYHFLSGNFYFTEEEALQDPRQIREGLDLLFQSWWGVTR